MSDKKQQDIQRADKVAEPTNDKELGPVNQEEVQDVETTNSEYFFKQNPRLERIPQMEADLQSYYPERETLRSELKELKKLLANPKVVLKDGREETMTPFAKKQIKHKISRKKSAIDACDEKIKLLQNDLTDIYTIIDRAETRARVRKAAKFDSYHERYSESIEKQIEETIENMDDAKLRTLKAEVTKVEFKTGNALMAKALINTPRYLHTRVVSNPEAMDRYMQYFRGKLTGVKAKSRKK